MPLYSVDAQFSRSIRFNLTQTQSDYHMASQNLVKENQPNWVDRGWYLVLDFGASRSNQFEKARDLARSLPNHQELVDENGQIVYRNIFRLENMPEFLELYRLVGKWQSCQLFVNGYKVGDMESENNGLACYLSYLEGDFNYCRNRPTRQTGGIPEYIGCFRSHVAVYPWGWKPWYNFIKRVRENRYLEVDLPGIIDTAHAHLLEVNLCPLINWDHTLAMIEALPREIDLKAEPHWFVNNQRQISPQNVTHYFDYMRQVLEKFLRPPKVTT